MFFLDALYTHRQPVAGISTLLSFKTWVLFKGTSWVPLPCPPFSDVFFAGLSPRPPHLWLEETKNGTFFLKG